MGARGGPWGPMGAVLLSARYLQDGGLRAALAGLVVAHHLSLGHLLVVEAEAAFLRAGPAHACKQEP